MYTKFDIFMMFIGLIAGISLVLTGYVQLWIAAMAFCDAPAIWLAVKSVFWFVFTKFNMKMLNTMVNGEG